MLEKALEIVPGEFDDHVRIGIVLGIIEINETLEDMVHVMTSGAVLSPKKSNSCLRPVFLDFKIK
jgi:hypothetical protein